MTRYCFPCDTRAARSSHPHLVVVHRMRLRARNPPGAPRTCSPIVRCRFESAAAERDGEGERRGREGTHENGGTNQNWSSRFPLLHPNAVVHDGHAATPRAELDTTILCFVLSMHQSSSLSTPELVTSQLFEIYSYIRCS